MFFAAVACSYGCALVLSLAMEMPVVHLDKLLFGPGGGSSHRQASSSRSTANTLENKVGAAAAAQKNGREAPMAGEKFEMRNLLDENEAEKQQQPSQDQQQEGKQPIEIGDEADEKKMKNQDMEKGKETVAAEKE
jgi:hypothetical protein